jgi:hypothetical protein
MVSILGRRDREGGLIATGQRNEYSNGTIHYDTNLTVAVSTDSGITAQGSHGRFAKFQDTRVRPLLPTTDNYSVALIRGNVTTDNCPLFVPLIRQSTASNPNPVTENGVQVWETQAQPGLALTWTGPVFASDNNLGFYLTYEQTYASWPNYGYIPYYIFIKQVAVLQPAFKVGVIDLSAISKCADCYYNNFLNRLGTALTSATGATITVTSPNAGLASFGQTFIFTNADVNITVVLDFTLPPNFSQLYGGAVSGTTGTVSRAGVLQACKLLGFQPGTTFTIPPSSTVAAPRVYQLGFRSTLNLYSYKNVRWVPQDTSAQLPSSTDMANGGYSGTYFDAYDYDHFLNQCVNPTFQRLIYDQFDDNVVGSERCLDRQLKFACIANCAASSQWNSSTSYAALSSVYFQGRAYYAQFPNVGISPASSSYEWVDIGPSICNSHVPGTSYVVGDAVTAISGGVTNLYYANTATSTTPPGAAWTLNLLQPYATGAITPNNPSVNTLPPVISFDANTQLFVLNLDSYGFGGTLNTNVDDGYTGVNTDSLYPQTSYQQTLNSALNDQARDSWGLTGLSLFNTAPGTCGTIYTTYRRPFRSYDERMIVEADDYFNQLFGNWQTTRLNYADPRFGGAITSYVRYTPQASQAGLAVPLPLPLQTPTVATGYLPYGRVGGNQPYNYTFPQNYPSVGLMWNPIDTIVVVSGSVPLNDDQVQPPIIIGDNGVAIGTTESGIQGFAVGNSGGGQSTNSQTLRIIGEFIVKSGSMQTGQELRNQIVFEPQFPVCRDLLTTGSVFNTFDYQVFMRMKATQILRPVTISNGGCVNMSFEFKRR